VDGVGSDGYVIRDCSLPFTATQTVCLECLLLICSILVTFCLRSVEHRATKFNIIIVPLGESIYQQLREAEQQDVITNAAATIQGFVSLLLHRWQHMITAFC